ncbi:SPOR domain-containing protein [Primorskyibacter sp. S87]|uniref:SPOR domain-containing protein n=1 Tax=Primorskyibacter sp. S87 TaxID=3415126 RepID=UPI003C7D1081
MNVTRAIVGAVVLGAISLGGAVAQTSGAVASNPLTPPAEFPPASYAGKQYVDSRGCVYVRASIDGVVAWAPRVTQQRQQVCGQKPTRVSASVATQVQTSTAQTTGASVRVAPAATSGGSARAPARYIAWNYENGQRQKVGVLLNENTRVVPRHVYDQQRLSQDVKVPRGYQRVWDDDRLNTRRAERSMRPPVYTNQAKLPAGYQLVDREDGRLNTRRGIRTERGDEMMGGIWDGEIPRRLRTVPTQGRVISAPDVPAYIDAAQAPVLVRISTRSGAEPQTPSGQGRYVRVGRFVSDTEAQVVAQALVQSGIPAKPGKARRGEDAYPVVLVGPYGSKREARAALKKVRRAGYPDARLSR